MENRGLDKRLVLIEERLASLEKMRRGSLGSLFLAYPRKKRITRHYIMWVLAKAYKVPIFAIWLFLKAQKLAPNIVPSLPALAPADTLYIDDGRYDYGLSQPDPGLGIKVEQDIEIKLRDGTKLHGDVYRPDAPDRFPVIMAWAPYPRQGLEQADPEYWVPRGYINISVNPRGYGGSEGLPTTILGRQEAEDYYDAIEWAAAQPWSTGNIGLYGISYYAYSQYWVASLKPPHLKAIVPWEGLADPYRDIVYRGGIPCLFGILWTASLQSMTNKLFRAENYLKLVLDHPLYDEDWVECTNPSPEEIDVPMLSVGALNDPDLHLRGNVNMFAAAKSPHKKLLLYIGTHWGSAYQPWATRTVLRFFDHWLKGMDTGIENEPAVDVQLRTASDAFTHIFGDTWPLKQTNWTKYYLDARKKTLNIKDSETEDSAVAQWTIDPVSGGSDKVTFLTEPLTQDLQVVGPLSAHIWVSSTGRDVDLTIELRDFNEDGEETRFDYYVAGSPDEPVTRGWLRASHRALDPERTLPHQPFHLHTGNDWMTSGVPVPVDIEIWPTAILFKAGHRIALTIHWGPHNRPGEAAYCGKPLSFLNKTVEVKIPSYQTFSPESGITRIHTGGEHSSWIELPVIPGDPAAAHHIMIMDGGFAPERVAGGMGDRFEWTNSGEGYHSVTESSGLGLWDSQLVRGYRSHNPETWWTRISWAGTFDYRDEVSRFEGTIEVPVRIPEYSPKGSPVKIELGIEPLPEGFGFDAQLWSGEGDWETIKEGIRDLSISISDLPPGEYAVRSRLRRLNDDASAVACGWSPPALFRVE